MSDYCVTGSCLCQGVGYEIHGHLNTFLYCHCSRCRKVTGSAFAANLMVAPKDFRWTRGEELVGRFELAGARFFATGFCTRCGSSLPWLTQNAQTVVVPAGSLDGDPQVKPGGNIFCASRGSWYVDPESLPKADTLPGKPG